MSPKKTNPNPDDASKPSSPARKSGGKKAGARKTPSAGGTRKPDEMPEDVLEFIQAIDDYKRKENRPFPTWSEILDIVKGLGYERTAS